VYNIKGARMKITENEFWAYEELRQSGLTNMFDTRTVSLLTGLDKDKIIAIMNGYSELMETYPEVRK